MKRYEEIVCKLSRDGNIDCVEGLVIMAAFEFTQTTLNQGGKMHQLFFIRKYGKAAYDRLLKMTGKRRH